MRFGKTFNERRNQGWRCISYDKLKQQIKVLDDTIDGAALFYESLCDEITQVDEFFKSVLSQAKNDIADADAFNVDVADVRQHAVLNYLAVLKILKKHDKKLQKKTRSMASMLCHLRRSSFSKRRFAQLLRHQPCSLKRRRWIFMKSYKQLLDHGHAQ